MSRIEVVGDICLSRPRPTQGCTADDDKFRHYCVILRTLVINTLPSFTINSNAAVSNTIYNYDVSHRFYASSHIIVFEISML
jgi:hypothetical protein